MSSRKSGKSPRFTVDARTILALGRESIKEPTTAVVELIKNAYDADASIVQIILDTKSKKIVIADNGIGMTEETVVSSWLRVGYSEKKQEPFSASGRRKTGEKGVGRLAANLLGDILNLTTIAEGSKAVHLAVDWREFEHSGRDVSDIPMKLESANVVFIPAQTTDISEQTDLVDAVRLAKSGTCIEINEIREDWTATQVKHLYESIAWLTPPTQLAKDFQVRFTSDIDSAPSGVVESDFNDVALITGEFSISTKGITKFKIKARERTEVQASVKWAEYVAPDLFASHTFGPATATIWYFPRTKETTSGTGYTLNDLSEFLDINSGIRVYRDQIRVRQYGEPGTPDHDWLNLGARKASNPAGKSRDSFRVGPTQIVGIVSLTRDKNPKLRDTTAREGFVQNEQFNELKHWLVTCLQQIELEYHRMASDKDDGVAAAKSPQEKIEEIQTGIARFRDEALESFRERLKGAKTHVPKKTAKALDEIEEEIADLSVELSSAAQWVKEVVDENIMLRGLATIGIAAANFSHETRNSLQRLSMPMTNAITALKMHAADEEDLIMELSQAKSSLKTAQEWSKFALARVAKDKRKRRKVPINEIVESLLADMNVMARASDISLHKKISQISSRVFVVDIESVLINLLTNAMYFSKRTSAKRTIEVVLQKEDQGNVPGFAIIVSDSGPGVSPRDKPHIWTPLYSTKTKTPGMEGGTGLGLFIVDSIVRSMKGLREVTRSIELGGARFRIWLPIVK